MTLSFDAVVGDNADNLMNAFYWIGQTLIAEDDGGIADIFEGAQDFRGGVGTDILNKIAETVGVDALNQRGSQLFDVDAIMDDVSPLVPDMEDMDETVVRDAAMMTATLFWRNVYRVFPEMKEADLGEFAPEIQEIAENYIKTEWSYTEDFPGCTTRYTRAHP